MEKIKRHNLILCHYFYFLVFLSFILLVVSRNSFLYEFNDAEDANTFYIVARYLLNGKVLYRDFFEQKGPIIYFLNVIGQLLFPKSFHGMYILEIIFGAFYYKYAYDTLECLNPNPKRNAIITLIGCSSSYAVPMLCHGGQVEEFALPLFAFLIYQIVRSIHTKCDMSKIALFSIGVQIACVFWSKYLVLMFYVLALVFYAGYCFYIKEFRRIINMFLYIGLGFLTISILMILYFIQTNSLSEMIQIYFVQNIFSYAPVGEQVNIIGKLINHMSSLVVGLGLTIVYIPLFFVMLNDVTSPVRKSKRTVVKIFVATVSFALVTCLIICGMSFSYYYIPCTVFNFLILYFLYDWTDELAKYREILKSGLLIVTIFPVISFLIYTGIHFGDYKRSISVTKEVSNIISTKEHNEVYIINTMDSGIYYNLDYLPDRYNFLQNNANYAEVGPQYWKAVEDQTADFVVMKLSAEMLNDVDNLDREYESHNYEMLYSSPLDVSGIAVRLYGKK